MTANRQQRESLLSRPPNSGHSGRGEPLRVIPPVDAGAITRVLSFTVSQDRATMIVERTGSRKDPPLLLHGQSYRRADDLVYNVDRAVYV